MTPKKKRHTFAFVCGLLALVGLSRSASADLIILKNGNRIEGRIEKKEIGPTCAPCSGKGDVLCEICSGRGLLGGRPCSHCGATGRLKCKTCSGRGHGEASYVIRMPGGMRTSIPVSQVKSIQRTEVAPEDLLPTRESYNARKPKAEGDPEDEIELARWALSKGLFKEAAMHARHAASVLPILAAEARKITFAADRRLEAEARRSLTAAFALIRSYKLAEGAARLEDALQKHAENPLLTSPDREREFLATSARDIVSAYGSTVRQIASSVSQKAKTACAACRGAGATPCAACKGDKEGQCSICRGGGHSWCPDCNGTHWRLCVSCGGAGRVPTNTLGASMACSECRSRGVVACRRCKNGRIPCPSCNGAGKIAGGCRPCSGGGSLKCGKCLGTGQKHVTRLLWGPVKEFSDIAQSDAVNKYGVWQGVRRGCIITLIEESILHGGAFGGHLAAITGARRDVLLICVDNRDGRDQVEFAPGQQGLRLVTKDARQFEAVMPDLEGKLAQRPEYSRMLAQLRPTAVLPGVLQNVAAVLPDGADLSKVDTIYWGREKPWRLKKIFIDSQELQAILKTLH